MKVKRNFTVTGMSCAGCVANVQTNLNKAKGVEDASVNLVEGRTIVTYNDAETSPEELKKLVQSLGYDMLIEESSAKRDEVREATEEQDLKQLRVKLIVTGLIAILMMILDMWGPKIGLSDSSILTVNMILSTVVMFWSAWGYHLRSLKQLRHMTFTMDTLISMSISVAYFFSLVRYILLGVPESGGLFSNSYFDVVGMIMTFVLLGRYIEERAKYRTNDALRKLIGLAPDTAIVKRGAEWQEIAVSDIQIGDIIQLRKGDRVPVDGELQETGAFDESSITGEPIPRHKEAGEIIYSGTVSVGNPTTFRTTQIGEETLLGRIVDAVKQAQATKAPIQRIADKVSGIFVPVILSIALITLLIWGFSGESDPWLHGLYFAITVMVIACPCALGLATPTAITVAMGKASEAGLLIKDALALERLAKVTDVIYDKTGTLTQGTPQVIADYWVGGRDEVAEALLVRAEQLSSHPLATAIKAKYSMMKSTATPNNLDELSGSGLRFEYNNSIYHIGNRELTPVNLDAEASRLEAAHPHSTHVYYSKDGILIALIVIEDELRPEASEALARLKQNGIELHLLSGDRQERAELLARKVGINHVLGGLSPIEKKEYIEELQRNGKVVAMVGDGINDSPALATADLSIAMGSGSDIATDVAQVTSIAGSPYSIEKAIRLSKRTIRTIYQNFFWAFIYNLLAVPIAAGLFYPDFFVTPMIAAAAMAFSSVSVVLNSLRLKSFKA